MPSALGSPRSDNDRPTGRTTAWSSPTRLGSHCATRSIHEEFKKLLAAAGLPSSHRPHDLRHSMATYLVAAGVNERVVMEILGHSTLAMTQRYSHVLAPMIIDAADRLEALWARAAATR